MAKKKVFVLTHNYPRDENDMSGIFIKNIINDLSDSFDFTVCPIRYGQTMHKLYKNPLKWPKLRQYFVNSSKKAREEFARDDFDLIWAHWWLPPGMIAAKLSRKTGCPLLVTCHGTDAFMLRDLKLLRPLANRVFRTARTVNVVSHYMATITTQDSVVANMPYNQEIFNYAGEEKDDHYIICPTALIKRKNVDLLIKGASKIPELKVKIYGDGILRELLEKMASDVPNVEMYPPLGQKKLAREYKKAGAIVLPSVNEGFGLTLVEGAACGCLPIATHDGGMVEICKQTGGLNFNFDPSGKTLEDALLQYLQKLPLDRAEIASSAKVYSREHIIPRFEEILRSTAKK